MDSAIRRARLIWALGVSMFRLQKGLLLTHSH